MMSRGMRKWMILAAFAGLMMIPGVAHAGEVEVIFHLLLFTAVIALVLAAFAVIVKLIFRKTPMLLALVIAVATAPFIAFKLPGAVEKARWFFPDHSVAPQWKVAPVHISEENSLVRRMEFSSDSALLCVEWESQSGRYKRIYDLNGVMVADAIDPRGEIATEYRILFAPLAPWKICSGDTEQGRSHPLMDQPLSGWVESPNLVEFTRDSLGWAFSPDYALGLRFTNTRFEEDLRRVGGDLRKIHLMEYQDWNLEMWQLKPEQRKLWTWPLRKRELVYLHALELFEKDGNPYVLLAFLGGKEILVLSGVNGDFVSRFNCGLPVSYEEILGRIRRFNLRGPDVWRNLLEFHPNRFVFEPFHRLLACANTFEARRVRVISVDLPHDIVLDLYRDEDPCSAGNRIWEGGMWRVNHISFAGEAHLIVESRTDKGRDIWPSYVGIQTDILDVRRRKRIWRSNSPEIEKVRLSPDAKRIAFLRKGKLELGNFDTLTGTE